MKKQIGLILGLAMAMAPFAAHAERPEIDCNSLPDDKVQEFYQLSGEMQQAFDEKKYDAALSIGERAMNMCTSDIYTEFMIARLYQLTNDCASAYYHYEILNNRPQSIKKENADTYKDLNKYFKEIKKKCGDVVTMEVTCKTPDTMLQISGVGNGNTIPCPYYGKVKPGAYPIVASKAGFVPAKETLTVSPSGGQFVMPALKEADTMGYINVKCPKGSKKWVLTSSDGTVDEYLCPWEGDIAPDTYRIYLSGTDPKDAAVITVGKKERVEHIIPSTKSSSCSAAPQNNMPGSFAGLFAFLGIIGLGFVARRRRAR